MTTINGLIILNNEIPDKELFEIIEKPDGRKYAKGKVVFQADHIQGRETVIYDKKTKKFILEFLDFWPLTIVIPIMLIGIVLGAALGWGG